MKYTRAFLLLLVGLVAVLSGLTAWSVYRARRQERLNSDLIVAVKHNDTKRVISLLNLGADANCYDKSNRHIPWWQFLRERVPGQQPKSFKVPTPLMLALQPWSGNIPHPENLALVKALLAHKADANVRDADGDTLLSSAIQDQQMATVHLLLKYGADVQPAHPGDQAGLAFATQCFAKSTDVIGDMLQRGADVNQRDVTGNTALYEAVWMQNVEAVRLLLSYHADVTIRGTGGDTLLALAKRFPNNLPRQQIIRLLQQAGEKN